MIIDFNNAKNYKINKFIDFLENIRDEYPYVDCQTHYFAKDNNRVEIYLNSRDQKTIDNKLVSQILLWTTAPNTGKYFQIIAYLENYKEFAYLRLWQNGKQYTIVRNSEGNIHQANNCTYICYPPQEVLPLSEETRKIFEEVFDATFTRNLPALEAHPKYQGVGETPVEAPNECDNKSRFTVIK